MQITYIMMVEWEKFNKKEKKLEINVSERINITFNFNIIF